MAAAAFFTSDPSEPWRIRKNSTGQSSTITAARTTGCSRKSVTWVGPSKDLKEAAGSNTPKQAAIHAIPKVAGPWKMPWGQETRDFLTKTIQRLYGGLRQMGLNVDILDGNQTLDGYRLVIP